ncbi:MULTISPECIES: ATP-dependent sacrificial sulfur transferase LarE [unclassified Akkermansia]|uniref:ATP-dependent sacrificial sulfur transferase LarE n=1 Tax=unclassified Akkermansia TaxID=2608915 RepID=UPI0025BD5D33|nr:MULTISPECIES: ATP-dependent sacrificial sulfur transferase LarE [unclassified Akkermansia]
MTTTPQTPFERLRAVLLPRERLAVALSGGLDSSVLLAAAVQILGADHCLALTAQTPYVMEEEVRDSTALCRRLGVRQEKLAFPIPPALANNPPLRCYLCKHALFSSLADKAAELGFPLLADGSNLDDLDDYRPGRRALQELGIPSPFLEAAMNKADIRRLACWLGLPESVSGKPAYACLLTRLEHNRPVTEALLRRVDAAESFLRTLGLKGCRVRVHGDSLARIELPEKEGDLFWNRKLAATVARRLRELGFRHITLDMEGYSRGSMNEPS